MLQATEKFWNWFNENQKYLIEINSTNVSEDRKEHCLIMY
nr:hypothetical protein [Mucilaginibacter sp. SP1R1]